MGEKAVLILYSEVMGYTMASIQHLVQHHPVKIYLVGWDIKKLTPYRVPDVDKIEYHSKSEFSHWRDLLIFAEKIKPEAVLVSGWMDRDYLRVIGKLKLKGIRIVSFIDNQWRGTLKQWAARLFMPRFLNRKFDYVWVSGVKQIEFARKMGFPATKIFTGFYSADVDLFSRVYTERNFHIREKGYPKNILYVGRFADVKGIDLLVNVFIQNNQKWSPWTLTLIGDGPLKDTYVELAKGYPKVIFKNFMPPEELKEDIKNAGIFVLPSRNEPWGVVIHEFAAAGVPIISSDACGANTDFLRQGVNGYIFQTGSTGSLQTELEKLIQSSDRSLMDMGHKSHSLSQKITPETWSQTFMEIINAA